MKDETKQLTMEEALEKCGNNFKKIEEGGVTQGVVVAINKDSVVVDVGYKSEGEIPKNEFKKNSDGQIEVKIGDNVEVMVEYWDEREEIVHISKDKAEKIKALEDLEQKFQDDAIIEGKVINRIKGGFSIDVNGVQAFLPGSQVDLKPVKNMNEVVGQTYEFKILKFNRKKNNIVLSRRAILEEKRNSIREKTLAIAHEGKVMEGVVKNITEYGVFVDIGGMDGLLHITDISWGRIKNPSEIFSVGDKINVKILIFDKEKERVSLGMKQLVVDPWIEINEKYEKDTKVTGKVVSITDYGAFLELEEGVEGLVHISEMSWTKKIRHPSNMLSVGDEVEAVILDVQKDERRISLGLKQAVQNPWELLSEKYPIGTIIEGQIKNITDFGVFVGIDDDIDGLVHISDLSWTKRIKHPSELYKKGDIVQAVVLDVDKDNERFSLGIKQNQEDPWSGVEDRYPIGTEVEGKITNVTDFGIFVELEEGIEGLIHISEVSEKKIETPIGKFNTGDTIQALVMNINSQEKRIGLSIKQLGLETEEDEEEPKQDEKEATTEAIKDEVKEDTQAEAKDETKEVVNEEETKEEE